MVRIQLSEVATLARAWVFKIDATIPPSGDSGYTLFSAIGAMASGS